MIHPIHWMKNQFKNRSYFWVLVLLTLLCWLTLYRSHIPRLFSVLYTINYSDINTAMISLFGTLFGFVFATLAILFSLREDSQFFQLAAKTNRTKRDIVAYFSIGIIAISVILGTAFVLTTTYLGNNPAPDELGTTVTVMNNMNAMLILSIPYTAAFALINILMILLTFILIVKE